MPPLLRQLTLTLVLTVFVAPVLAQTQADVRAKALALVAEGGSFFDAGNYVAALEKFSAAFKVLPSPKIKYNIALALRELRREREAAEQFRAFLTEAPDAAADARKEAAQALGELRSQLAVFDLTVDEPGATVVMAGRAVGTTPLPGALFAEPGLIELQVSKEGFEKHKETLLGLRGSSSKIQVKLKRVVASPPPTVAAAVAPAAPPTASPAGSATTLAVPIASTPARSPDASGSLAVPVAVPSASLATPTNLVESSRHSRGVPKVAYVAGGVGVVGLASGVILGVMTRSNYDELAKKYEPDQEASSKRLNALQVVGYGVGVVGIGAAVVLALLHTDQPVARAAAGTSNRLGLQISARSAGLRVAF